MPEPPERTLTVARNAYNVRRTVSLSMPPNPYPNEPPLVRLDVYNSTGGHAFALGMTREEAQALIVALQELVWSPPDA